MVIIMVNETMNKPTEIYNHTINQQAIKIGKMKLLGNTRIVEAS